MLVRETTMTWMNQTLFVTLLCFPYFMIPGSAADTQALLPTEKTSYRLFLSRRHKSRSSAIKEAYMARGDTFKLNQNNIMAT